jgi:LuxR family maltose regulon positive regulatory protein
VSAWLAADGAACVAHALAGLHELGEGALADPVGRFGWNLVAHGIALGERWSDDGELVAPGRAAVGNDRERRLAFEGARALGLALAGQPVDALRVAAGVRQPAGIAEMWTLTAELDLAEALAARELGDRDRAARTLAELAGRSAYPMTYVRALALQELVELRLAEGEVAAAQVAFEQLEELVLRELDGRDARCRLARAGVLLAVAHDDVEAAQRWADRTDDPFWRPVAEARVHLARDQRSDAAAAVHRAEPRTARHRVVQQMLVACATSDADREAAVKAVEVAIELAAEHGMLETVAADAVPVLDLVELAAWRAPVAWMDRLRRSVASPMASGSAAAPGMAEPLTDRERDVLRLLPSRLTLREIAAELFVSPNTLKFHLRVIYRKLGVNSRAEAIDAARRLRLLGR